MEYIFYLLGPALFIWGVISSLHQKEFVKTSTIIPATVTEIRKGPASKNKTAYYPIMKYLNPVSQVEEVFESGTPFEPDRYKVGDIISIRYLCEGAKKKIAINNWFGIWGLSFMLVLFGCIFTAFSVVILLNV